MGGQRIVLAREIPPAAAPVTHEARLGERLAGLRAAVARIEARPLRLPQGGSAGQDQIARGKIDPEDYGPDSISRPLRFGIAAIDDMLGRAPAAALHEVRAATGGEAAAAGFALALGDLAAEAGGFACFVAAGRDLAEAGDLYGPGLEALGLCGRALVRVRPRTLAEALWAAGEAATTPGAGFCLLEIAGNPRQADLSLTRRLALRAAASGTPVLLLRQGGAAEASAASTRWLVQPAPSRSGQNPPGGLVEGFAKGFAKGLLGPPAFDVTLEKSRRGRAGRFLLEWSRHERRLALRPERNIERDIERNAERNIGRELRRDFASAGLRRGA
jgi:protein ImuA